MKNKKNTKKIHIDINSICRDLIRNIWIIILSAVMGFMGIYVFEHSVYKPEYMSTATLAVTAKTGNYTSYTNLVIESEMADIFSEIFTQSAIKEKAMEYLGEKTFDGKITTSVVENTNILQLSIKADNPETAYRLIKAVLEVYPQVSDNVFGNAVIYVIRQPIIPRAASNSISAKNRDIILAACCVAAALIIVIISAIKDTVKNEKFFHEKIDEELFETVPHEKTAFSIKKKNKKSLFIYNNFGISLRFSESFHKIAAKIEFMKRKNGDSVFAVSSAVEKEGKSTVAANIAIALACKGNKVLLIDLNAKNPDLYKIIEEDESKINNLNDCFSGKILFSKFSFNRFHLTNLYLALNTVPYDNLGKWIEKNNSKEYIKTLKKSFDYVIIDTPSLSSDPFVTDIASSVDKTFIVVKSDKTYISKVNDAILSIKNVGGNIAGCILNDLYSENSLFKGLGLDEGGYRYYKGYKKYGKYMNYGKYSYYG
ncbi:MAG: AAA family ATPase, partial [Ruminococcus sp.]|nr:AAA family ATPase [Candidatus Copronaster equi]